MYLGKGRQTSEDDRECGREGVKRGCGVRVLNEGIASSEGVG